MLLRKYCNFLFEYFIKKLSAFVYLSGFLLSMPFTVVEATNPIYQTLKQDILINADYWFYTPKIIGASLGFTQILGVPGVDTTPAGQQAVIDAGGAWEVLSTTTQIQP